MRAFLFVFVTLVAAQEIDKAELDKIFGTPPPITVPTEATSKAGFDQFTVKPTELPTIIVNNNGQSCQCVPYYLCNKDLVGVDINNASVTGYGQLDVRFGENTCQESVELCCTNPINPADVPKSPPVDPAKLKACGYRNPNGVNVIVNFTGGSGDEAQFGELPWIVALINTDNSSYMGVGVIVHPQVIMTAAHIVYRSAPGKMKIRAGEWDTQTAKEELPHQEREVQEIYYHENFHPRSVINDIALLRLDQPLQLDQHINVLCMPDQDESFDESKECVVGGWGKDSFGMQGRYAIFMKRISVDMVPHERCNDLLRGTRLGNNFKLHSTFVCAGGEEGKDVCTGDGGAPLACPIGNNRYKLAGLVAYGVGCGQQGVPGVYAKVSAFRQLVDQKLLNWGYKTTGYRA